MKRKIGRNDPCWCGSGLKYKKCHLGREEQAPVSFWEASKEITKTFSFKTCLVPEQMKSQCSRQFIKSHTVPKKGSLQNIARDGHVYSFKPDPKIMARYKSLPPPHLIGINKASTFSGFCSTHDNEIFKKVEDQPFKFTVEQCFLLAYRALAREFYMKVAEFENLQTLRKADRGKSKDEQYAMQEYIRAIGNGINATIKDNIYHKELYDKVLLSGIFESVRSYVIQLASAPAIMCSAGIFPEHDFEGNLLQCLTDYSTIAKLLTFNSFYSGEHGAIVFTWLSDSDEVCQPFIDSLRAISKEELTNAIIRFFFEYSENLHIQPEWWEKLSIYKRDALIKRFYNTAAPHAIRSPKCLISDGIHYDDWDISNFTTIGF